MPLRNRPYFFFPLPVEFETEKVGNKKITRVTKLEWKLIKIEDMPSIENLHPIELVAMLQFEDKLTGEEEGDGERKKLLEAYEEIV